MVITHEMELLALMGRQVEVIDPHGRLLGDGRLYRAFDAGRTFWRVIAWHVAPINWPCFELSDVADIAGTVIELRGGAR